MLIRRNIKKPKMLIFMAMFCLFAFAPGACKTGGEVNPPEKIVIKALAYGDEGNTEGQTWIRVVRLFEAENPGIKIQYKLADQDAYHREVKDCLAAGGDAIPDIACMGADGRWAAPWKEAGQQFDHRPYLDRDYFDLQLIPPMGPAGEIWEIPLGTANISTVLYMNEELVRSLGFSTPGKYEDLVAMVPGARAAGLEVIAIAGAQNWVWNGCLLSCIIGRLSGDAHWVSRAVAGEYRFTDKAFVDSLRLIQRMVDDGVISRESLLVDYATAPKMFSDSKALFLVDGQWQAGREAVSGGVALHTRMIAWPLLPGEKPKMAGSAAGAIEIGYGLTKKGGAIPPCGMLRCALSSIICIPGRKRTND